MYVLVAGGGHMGTHLVTRLVAEGHDTAVIDMDREVTDRIFAEHGVVVFTGSATDLTVLEQAGLKRADVAVAMTGQRRGQPRLLPPRPLLRRAAGAGAHAEPAVRGAVPAGGRDQDPQRGRHPGRLVPDLDRVSRDRRPDAGGQGGAGGLRAAPARDRPRGGKDDRRDRAPARTSRGRACSSAWRPPPASTSPTATPSSRAAPRS